MMGGTFITEGCIDVGTIIASAAPKPGLYGWVMIENKTWQEVKSLKDSHALSKKVIKAK